MHTKVALLGACVGLFGLASTAPALADGQIGLNYFSGNSRIPTVTSFSELPVNGPGVSLGLNLTDTISWNAYRNYQDGDERVNDRIGPRTLSSQSTFESNSWGTGFSYAGDTFWVSLRFSRSENESRLYGPLVGAPAPTALAVDFAETQSSQVWGVQIGRDWVVGNWSPSLSLGFQTQESEISRREILGRVNFTQIQIIDEDLSGTDLDLSASVLYFIPLENEMALMPSLGLFHQIQISGELNGLSQLGLRTAESGRRLSSAYREDVNADSQTSVDAGINWLVGDWIINGTYITNLSADSAGDSILLGLTYSF